MSCFIYYGHFYRLSLDGEVYHCRSTLEIIRSCNQTLSEDAAQSPGEFLLNRQPNAVFVMLNPGSSRPCDGRLGNEITNPCQINNDARSNLVLACPDDTQQAVEKVMTGKQFDHARVLNLFDIRKRNSNKLIRKIRSSIGLRARQHIPDPPEIKSYSIFSCERRSELGSRLNAENRQMVIAAWSTKDALKPFFKRCFQILEGDGPNEGDGFNLDIYGQQPEARVSPLEDRKFYHPSRKPKKWPKYILRNWPDNAQRQG